MILPGLTIRKGMPVIVTGNFNIIVPKSEKLPFIDFMKKYLYLDLALNCDQTTSRDEDSAALTFVRDLRLQCQQYYAFFLNHRPTILIFDE